MNSSEDNAVPVGAEGRGAAEMIPLVYAELRRLAEAWMAKAPPGQTLQPTALVHEVFLRLLGKDERRWENRGHFFFAAARAMRDVLVEKARSKGRIKRGGDRKRIDLEELEVAAEASGEALLALNEVLGQFESEYPKEHEIVMLRFFAGLTCAETAKATGTPLRTIERDWRFARAWLSRELAEVGVDSDAESEK